MPAVLKRLFGQASGKGKASLLSRLDPVWADEVRLGLKCYPVYTQERGNAVALCIGDFGQLTEPLSGGGSTYQAEFGASKGCYMLVLQNAACL